MATELIGRGMPAEAALRQRSRELRALIESPAGPGRRPAATSGRSPATVVSEVRRALLLPSTAAAVRAMLVSWLRPR